MAITKLEKSRLLEELRRKFADMEAANKRTASVFFGVNNVGVFRNGDVVQGQSMLRILEEEDWKRELMVCNQAGMAVKALELYKQEVTSVSYFAELGSDPFELRYYGVDWMSPETRRAMHDAESEDERTNAVPKALSDVELSDRFVYVFAEMKRIPMNEWRECCVCGIKRADTIACAWNANLSFCGMTCQQIAFSQKQHDSQSTGRGGGGGVRGRGDDDMVIVDKCGNELEALNRHFGDVKLE